MEKRLKLLYSSLTAGFCIGIGSLLFIISKTYLGPVGLLVGSLLFPLGLISICYLQIHLYTGKIGFIAKSTPETRFNLTKAEWLTWMIIGNFIGAMLIGLVIYMATYLAPDSSFTQTVLSIGNSKVLSYDINSISIAFVKSFLCGIFVYLAVLFFNTFKKHYAKLVGIIVPIALFVYCGFWHCIANMTYLVASGQNIVDIIYSLLVCTLGNSLGALFTNKLLTA